MSVDVGTPEALVEDAKPLPHAKKIDSLVKKLNTRLSALERERDKTVDERREAKLIAEMRMIHRTLGWLPGAKEIPRAPVRFGSHRNKYGRIHIGVPGVIDRQLKLERYILDTDDPIEIAALRYHISRGIEPQIQEIPPGFVPSFVGGRRPQFYQFVPEETARAAIESGAANVIMP